MPVNPDRTLDGNPQDLPAFRKHTSSSERLPKRRQRTGGNRGRPPHAPRGNVQCRTPRTMLFDILASAAARQPACGQRFTTVRAIRKCPIAMSGELFEVAAVPSRPLPSPFLTFHAVANSIGRRHAGRFMQTSIVKERRSTPAAAGALLYISILYRLTAVKTCFWPPHQNSAHAPLPRSGVSSSRRDRSD